MLTFYQNIQIPPTLAASKGERVREGRQQTTIRTTTGTLGSFSAWYTAEQQQQQQQQQQQATEFVENCCFPRISDDTLGSFSVWYSAEEQQHQQQQATEGRKMLFSYDFRSLPKLSKMTEKCRFRLPKCQLIMIGYCKNRCTSRGDCLVRSVAAQFEEKSTVPSRRSACSPSVLSNMIRAWIR